MKLVGNMNKYKLNILIKFATMIVLFPDYL